jgi:hypothetical protein
MLLHARGQELRRGGELSTATRRWRLEDGSGRRGTRASGHQGRGERSGPGEDDTWEGKPAGGGARGAASAASGDGRGEAEGEAAVPEEDEAGRCQGDLFMISKKFRDPSVN